MFQRAISGQASIRGWGLLILVGGASSACSSDGRSSTDLTGPSAANSTGPSTLPGFDQFKSALTSVQRQNNGGLGFNMWGTIVDRRGVVVAVVFTGNSPTEEWPGSRVISAQKANTANAFSLKEFALSTANLYAAVQPGGSLYGLEVSNPVDETQAYQGEVQDYGTLKDPLMGKKLGGVNVFGGGLALYGSDGTLLGALGVSGDLSCADHNIAWKVRHALHLDFVPKGVANGGKDDNIIYDLDANDKSPSGFGHPVCNDATKTIGQDLPSSDPISHP
jgi:uncharacterized protein GlcG (DUF336 family)